MNREQYDAVKHGSKGEWSNILQELAGLNDLQVSIKTRSTGTSCPICGGTDRYSFKNIEDGSWACRKCGGGDGWEMLKRVKQWDFSTANKNVGHWLGIINDDTDFTNITQKSIDRQKLQKQQEIKNTTKAKSSETFFWDNAKQLECHPWTEHKKLSIQSRVLCKQSGDKLLIPIFNPAGERISHQSVALNPNDKYDKRFYSGVPVAGGLLGIGSSSQPESILITESFADGDAALQLAGNHDHKAICAFSATNIPAVARYANSKYPNSKILICADNDDAGRKAVQKAQELVSDILVSFPPSGKDWSEYFLSGGKKSPVMNCEEQNQHKETFELRIGSEGYDTCYECLIKDYLPSDSFGVVYGSPGSYKSFHAVSWAASIATGRDWNGKKCTKGTVIYIVGEGGSGVPRRIKGWEVEYNNNNTISNLFTIPQPVFISNNQQIDTMIETIKEVERRTRTKVTAVFIDTLARCFAGADENKTADMNMFISGCDKIKTQTGASIVVIHHSGKNDDAGARGSSALRAAADFEFKISRPDGEHYYVLKQTKAKDSDEQEAVAFDMAKQFLFTDKDGDEVVTLVPSVKGREPPKEDELPKVNKLTGNHEAVWQAVRSRQARKETTNKRIIFDDLKAQGLNIKNFSRWVDKLVNDGILGKSKNGDLYSKVN
ncbi:MAG: AAA family ATPase [Endozoicomonadaceae bacterium]|nr:AAA family ATPase [Endozoicomonadaceae bacterium]